MRSRGFKMILLGIIALAAISAIIMFLWNLIIPGILGLATINFWQALGLFILTRILFGRYGFGNKARMIGHRMYGVGENPIHEKWMKMTNEQRKEFIEKRRKFGFGDPFRRGGFPMDDSEDIGKENE